MNNPNAASADHVKRRRSKILRSVIGLAIVYVLTVRWSIIGEKVLKTNSFYNLQYVQILGERNILIDDATSYVSVYSEKNGTTELIAEYDKNDDDERAYIQRCFTDGEDIYLSEYMIKGEYSKYLYGVTKVEMSTGKCERIFKFDSQIFADISTKEKVASLRCFPHVVGGMLYTDVSAELKNGQYVLRSYVHDSSSDMDSGWELLEELYTDRVFKTVRRTDFGYICLDDKGNMSSCYDQGQPYVFPDRYREVFNVGDDKYAALNITNNTIDIINPSGRSVTVYDGLDVDPRTVKDLKISGDMALAAIVGDDTDYSASGYIINDAGDEKTEYRINWSFMHMLLRGSLIFAVFIVIIQLMYLAFSYFHNKASVLVREIIIIIPLLLLTCIVVAIISFTSTISDQDTTEYNNMNVLFEQLQAQKLFDKFDDYDTSGLGDSTKNKDVAALSDYLLKVRSDNHSELYKSDDSFTSALDLIYVGYDGSDYVMLAGEYPGCKFKNTADPYFYQMIEDTIANDKNKSFVGYMGINNEYVIGMVYPTHSEAGKVNGAVILFMDYNDYEESSVDQVLKAILFNIGVVVIAAIVFIIVSKISLRPLKKLSNKAMQITTEGYVPAEEKTQRNFCDEITLIDDALDEFARNAKANLEDISRFRSTIKAYFPDSLAKTVNKDNIAFITFKEYASGVHYMLTACLPGEYGVIGKLDELINAISSDLEEYGAFIYRTDGFRLSIVSRDPYSLNIAFGLRRFDSRIYCTFDKCETESSIIGGDDKYTLSIVPTDRSRERILHSYYSNMGVMTAVTGRALDGGIEDMIEYCIGKLGDEYVYSVSSDARDNVLKLTRAAMKKGIDSYIAGEHEVARSCFVEVLKTVPDSQPARYYISVIDSASNSL